MQIGKVTAGWEGTCAVSGHGCRSTQSCQRRVHIHTCKLAPHELLAWVQVLALLCSLEHAVLQPLCGLICI